MKMKKNKLANLLKLGILLFGISFFLFSCEKDELITIEVSSKIIPKKMSISEAKKDKDFILVSEKFKLNPYLNENNLAKKSNEFTIDFSSFYKITKENYTSYTFLLKRNNKDNSITENLVIEKRNDTVRGYIVKYSNIFYKKSGTDLFLNATTSRTYFKGNIEELLEQNNIKFHNKAGWSCSWNTTYTPRTCSVHGEFNEGNSDCGNYGKSNWTSSSYQTCSYNPTENTLSESSGHNLDFGSGGGGGGGSGSSETVPIINCDGDESLQPKTVSSDCIQILEEDIYLDQANKLKLELEQFDIFLNSPTFDALNNPWLDILREYAKRLEQLKDKIPQILWDKMNKYLDRQLITALTKTAFKFNPDADTTKESNKQHEFQNNGERGIGILLYEFANGEGLDNREFSNGDFWNKFFEGDRKAKIKADFEKILIAKNLTFEQFVSNGKELGSSYKFSPDHAGVLESFEEHKKANWVQFFVGGTSIEYRPSSQIGYIDVKLINPTSRNSLLLHIGKNYDRNPQETVPLSTIEQSFYIKIKIK